MAQMYELSEHAEAKAFLSDPTIYTVHLRPDNFCVRVALLGLRFVITPTELLEIAKSESPTTRKARRLIKSVHPQ